MSKSSGTAPRAARADTRRFFALTLLWTGALWGAAALSPQEWSAFPTVLLYVLGGVGPSLVAIVLVARGFSPERPRAFWRRVIDPRRIPPVWYAAILAIAFLPNLLAKLAPAGSTDTAGSAESMMLGAILVVAVLAGFAEELGWRGYALDRLLNARSALAAGLIVGMVWTLWHLPLYFIGGTIQNEAGLWSRDFWFDMAARIPLSVLFTWVYVNTNRSILSAVLLHAVDNIASVVVAPEGTQLLVRFAVVTALAVLVTAVWGAQTLRRRTPGTPSRVRAPVPVRSASTPGGR